MKRFAGMRIASTACLLSACCSVSAFTAPTVAHKCFTPRASETELSDLDELDKADTPSVPETPPVPMTLVSSEASYHLLSTFNLRSYLQAEFCSNAYFLRDSTNLFSVYTKLIPERLL